MGALARPQLVAARGVAFTLAFLVVGAALLNLADAATPSLLGRDLNLYWDLRHLPSLVGLARESAGLWSVASAAALVFGALSLVVASAYMIWRKVLSALTDRRVAIGLAILLGVTLDVTAFVPAEHRPARRCARPRLAHIGRRQRSAPASARNTGSAQQRSRRFETA
jgi:hypothetical protein